MPAKNQKRKSNSYFCLPSLDRSALVPAIVRAVLRCAATFSAQTDSADLSDGGVTSTTSNERLAASRLEALRSRFRLRGFSERVVELLLAVSRKNTLSSYESAWRNWLRWCMKGGKDPFSADLAVILDFLSSLKDAGKAYSTINVINVHRSMLSQTLDLIEGLPIGENPLVVKLLKACYNDNPPQPRYPAMWEPEKVLSYIASLGENSSLSLSQLAGKAVTLIALATLLRVAEIAAIGLQSVKFSNEAVHFSLKTLRKTQRVGPLGSFSIKKFSNPVETIKTFMKATVAFRSGTEDEIRLWVSVRPPQGPVTANTIARWIKNVLKESGIDTNTFSAHSTRSVAASQAARVGWSTEAILRAGNWARESNFNRFYNRS
jgi:site-specific recombinase XerD